MNGTGRHDSFSLFGLFLGVMGAVLVFIMLFFFAPMMARMIGY